LFLASPFCNKLDKEVNEKMMIVRNFFVFLLLFSLSLSLSLSSPKYDNFFSPFNLLICELPYQYCHQTKTKTANILCASNLAHQCN